MPGSGYIGGRHLAADVWDAEVWPLAAGIPAPAGLDLGVWDLAAGELDPGAWGLGLGSGIWDLSVCGATAGCLGSGCRRVGSRRWGSVTELWDLAAGSLDPDS